MEPNRTRQRAQPAAAAGRAERPSAVSSEAGHSAAAHTGGLTDQRALIGSPSPTSVLALQRAAGNAAVVRLLRARESGAAGDSGPQSENDKHTLAHELTHVLQQRNGPVAGTDTGSGLNVSEPGDRFEREAEATATKLLAGPAAAPAASTAGPDDGSAPGSPMIQRLLIGQVSSSDGQRVSELNIIGRPASPYTSTMGDHTTAFVVQADAVRRCVIGRTPVEAAAAIGQLYADTLNLVGAGAETVNRMPAGAGTHREKLDNAGAEVVHLVKTFADDGVPEQLQMLELQKLVGAFLHYRELVPLSTINVKSVHPALAGKGHGESAQHLVLEARKRGAPLDVAAEQQAVWKLLDSQGVALVATESEQRNVLSLAPGLDPATTCDERISLLVRQHLQSIELAYPGIIAEAWTDANAAALALTTLLALPVAEFKRKNREVYTQKIARCDDKLIRYRDQIPIAATKEKAQLTLYQNDELNARTQLSAVLVANGGTASAPPSLTVSESSGRSARVKTVPNRLVNTEEEPKKARAKRRVDDTSKDEDDEKHVDSMDTVKAEAAVDEDAQDEEEMARQPLAAQIIANRDGVITNLLSAGRSGSPFSDSMGAHTTAWLVHIDAIRSLVEGRPLMDALGTFHRAIDEADAMRKAMEAAGFTLDNEDHGRKLEASRKHLSTQYDKALAKETPDRVRPLLLQDCVNALLTYVNYIPGATINAVDTSGKGEGTIRKELLAYEADREGKVNLDRDRLAADLLGLLDLKAVGGDSKRIALVANHLALVAQAYPRAMADSRLDPKDPAGVLVQWQRFAAQKRSAKSAKMGE